MSTKPDGQNNGKTEKKPDAKALEDQRRSAIAAALGEVSTAWSVIPRGVFDDQKAKDIGDALYLQLFGDNIQGVAAEQANADA